MGTFHGANNRNRSGIMSKIKSIQNKIDQTEYWDLNVLDFQAKFFGDEVNIYFPNDEKTSWRILFSSCYKVSYETDATWRTIKHVHDMKKPQLGYFGQKILVKDNNDFEGFYDVTIDLTILTAEIICKEVSVEKVSNDSISVFWREMNSLEAD